ncbi:fumarylacetoacetate hydrolase family protein [Mucilaginibacter ginkgonis]|uniref:Fumarylacetoacetate hydrolase family protein n=1 Tax=Mucilaginibacter ginkgonis TaxID=2682091 RepID=A0A6I4IN83_9SPHI|nr:fumarylacetoacetate hydrolase family protein [Mucilaginibacter ginkgonis]QQL49439.1 fumarylacetoacetate hydrolase family protein [Mucilaginibacter ginkgonis]
MKLIRFGEPGQEKPGIIINNKRFDVSAFVNDYNETFFAGDGLSRLNTLIDDGVSLSEVSASTRLGPPMARPSKIVCIGLNYRDHAIEVGAPIPSEPVIFIKSTTALSGPNDNIIIPKGSVKTDWEAELAVVIGRRTGYADEANVPAHIAGYVLHNDVSERAFMFERNGTWDKGKGCDTFAPMGPFIATPDEMPPINNLNVWLKVNGKQMQNGNTRDMIFGVNYLISYISQFMTLLPGDVVSTGTPAGVGFGLRPQVFLQPGDVVELGIDGLGSQRQVVKAYSR